MVAVSRPRHGRDHLQKRHRAVRRPPPHPEPETPHGAAEWRGAARHDPQRTLRNKQESISMRGTMGIHQVTTFLSVETTIARLHGGFQGTRRNRCCCPTVGGEPRPWLPSPAPAMDEITFKSDTVLSDVHLHTPNQRHLMVRLSGVGQPVLTQYSHDPQRTLRNKQESISMRGTMGIHQVTTFLSVETTIARLHGGFQGTRRNSSSS
ncbi:uncharacterized protein LOC133104537 [Eubalaena glacialis]|uniref:uncharacterized protein LOC133104537 n=1 Tax=Eubalaena glacialis TaxID=27606 RepID=UPI002A598C7E|nr:uncharacterized protein LOC133104537 [Eubalaena glacialis]